MALEDHELDPGCQAAARAFEKARRRLSEAKRRHDLRTQKDRQTLVNRIAELRARIAKPAVETDPRVADVIWRLKTGVDWSGVLQQHSVARHFAILHKKPGSYWSARQHLYAGAEYWLIDLDKGAGLTGVVLKRAIVIRKIEGRLTKAVLAEWAKVAANLDRQ